MNKFELKKKIVVGSANFTQRYGVDPVKVDLLEKKKNFKYPKKK